MSLYAIIGVLLYLPFVGGFAYLFSKISYECWYDPFVLFLAMLVAILAAFIWPIPLALGLLFLGAVCLSKGVEKALDRWNER